MRKVLLLVASVPLLLAPPAVAADTDPPAQGRTGSICRAPDIDLDYDIETFTATASLPVSGCETREHNQFALRVTIIRIDNTAGSHDLIERQAVCGPFRSANDVKAGEDAPKYSCNLAVFLTHADVETAEYSVDVFYPDSKGEERRIEVFTFCTSDGSTASCEV